jgi:hypothetical protein
MDINKLKVGLMWQNKVKFMFHLDTDGLIVLRGTHELNLHSLLVSCITSSHVPQTVLPLIGPCVRLCCHAHYYSKPLYRQSG